MISVLKALGIKPQVQDFFAPWLEAISEEQLNLTYHYQKKGFKREVIKQQGYSVPSTDGVWCAGAHHPHTARHNFLFYSATEILSFCSINTCWLAKPGNIVFSALGLLPFAAQFRMLRRQFPNARLHTVFGNDLPGRVMDCKAALWCKAKDANFQLVQDMIVIQYNSKTLYIPEPIFSLNLFEQISGLRSGIRTHKPKAGFSSFLELLRADPS